MSRYECKLSPELLEKAVTELNEPRDNAERLKAIDELKSSYNATKYGPLVQENDEFFLKFLRAKKFDQKKALTVLHNYHSVKKDYKDVFDKVRSPSALLPVIRKGIILMITGKAKDGSAVMFSRDGLVDKTVDIFALMAYGVLSIEKLLEEEQYQICGLSTIGDMANLNIAIFTKVSPIAMGKMMFIWQEAMPMRYKHLHVINEGTVYDILMAIIKPFMKKKMLDRIHLHGSNYRALNDYIDPCLLPPYIGGTGPDPNELAKHWGEKVMEDWPQGTML